MTMRRNRLTIILLSLALCVITLSVYLQVRNHAFINYDDDAYVTNNPHVVRGLTGENIIWAFTSAREKTGNWHPITWLSHMTDVQLFGLNPGGHHITNVFIHIASSVLLLLLLARSTGSLWQSAFVSALFALHPLHVESVAWVAERKDVLSAFFMFLSLLFYCEYVAKRKSMPYILALASFVLGLMSKAMPVTLPIIMLLLDFWPLGRRKQKPSQAIESMATLIKEKVPFIACSVITCIVTIYTQAEVITSPPFRFRIENALIAYIRYIGKTFWPHDLSVLYPLHFPFPLWQVTGSSIILLFLSVIVIRARVRYPYLAVGWFWFLITLMPVIGLIQVGVQSMADRYTYIPLIGLFIMVAWGGADVTKGLKYRGEILALLAGAMITAATALTWQQIGYWRDSISLYEHTLQATTGNYVIHNNLGSDLLKKGHLDRAIQEFQESIRIKPRYTPPHTNLGIALVRRGDFGAAILEFSEVTRREPDNAQAHANLGFALANAGDSAAALAEYQEAVRINPAFTTAHKYLEGALAQKSMLDAVRK